MAPKRVKKEITTLARGDVVFAKVKGYSPWPAEITNVLSKSRYSVVFFATRETANLVYSAIFPYNDANRVKFASDRMLEKKDFAMAFVEMEAKVRKQKRGKQKDINQNIASVGSDTESDMEAEDPQVSKGGAVSSKPEEPASKPSTQVKKRTVADEPPTKENVGQQAEHVPGAPLLSEESSSDEEELPAVPKAPIKKVAAAEKKASSSKSKHPKKVVAASAKSEMTSASAEEDSEVDDSIRKASVGSDTESDIEAEDPQVSNGKGSGSTKPEEPASKPTVKATKRAIAVESPTKANVGHKAVPGAHVLSEESSSDEEELPAVPKAPIKKVAAVKEKASSSKSKHPKKVVAASAKSEMTGASAEEDSEVDDSIRKASVGSDTESDIEAEDPQVSNGKGSGSTKPEEPASKPTVKATKRAIAVESPTKANVGHKAVPGAHVLSEKSSSDEEELPAVPKAPIKKVAAAEKKASSSKSKHHKKVVEESAEEDSEVDNSIRKVAKALKEKLSEAEEEDRNLESSHHDEEVSPKKKRQKSSTKQSSSGAMRRQTTKHVKPLTKKAQPSSAKVMAAKPKQSKSNNSAKAHSVAQRQLQEFLPVIRETLFEAKLLDSKQGLQALKYLQGETIPKISKLLLLKFPELIETLEEICGMKNSRVFKEKSKTIKLVADQMLTALAERFGDGSTETFLEAFAKESAVFKEMTRNVQRHKIDAADTMEDLEKLIEEAEGASMTDPDAEAEGSASDETSETENEDAEEELSDEDEAAEEDENGADDNEDEAVEEDEDEDEDENEDEDSDGLRF